MKTKEREDQKIKTFNYSHLIFDKGAKNTHWRETHTGAGKTGYLHADD
jgi:hypothetical protein